MEEPGKGNQVSPVVKRLSKVRTFHDDLELARGKGETKTAVVTPQPPPPPTLREPRAKTIFRAPSSQQLNEPPSIVPSKPTVAAVEKPLSPGTVAVSQKVIPPPPDAKINVDLSEAALEKITSEEKVSVLDASDYASEGTIVTDKKRARFSLFPAMWEAVNYWVNKEKRSFESRAEKKRQAIPTVRPIEERQQIVEKAAAGSALAPKDDYKTLAKKIPPAAAGNKSTKVAPMVIKQKSAVQAPSWHHFVGAEAVEENPEVVKIGEPITVAPETPVQAAPTLVPPPPTPISEAVPATPKIEEVPPTIEPSQPLVREQPVSQTLVETPSIKIPAPIIRTASRNRSGWFSRTLVYASGVVIAIVAIGSGVTFSLWLLQSDPNEVPLATKDETLHTNLVRYDEAVSLPLPNDRTELRKGVLFASVKPTSQLSVIIPSIGKDRAKATDILSVMRLRADGSFLRNIEEIVFGLYSGAPFIVMRIGAFDTAFGGILDAEDTLPEDLTLFTEEKQSGSYRFVDEVIKNRDARVLRYENGEEGFVYGFINRQTLLIAKDQGTWSDVADAVR